MQKFLTALFRRKRLRFYFCKKGGGAGKIKIISQTLGKVLRAKTYFRGNYTFPVHFPTSSTNFTLLLEKA